MFGLGLLCELMLCTNFTPTLATHSRARKSGPSLSMLHVRMLEGAGLVLPGLRGGRADVKMVSRAHPARSAGVVVGVEVVKVVGQRAGARNRVKVAVAHQIQRLAAAGVQPRAYARTK